jgi:hypothetical protein
MRKRKQQRKVIKLVQELWAGSLKYKLNGVPDFAIQNEIMGVKEKSVCFLRDQNKRKS